MKADRDWMIHAACRDHNPELFFPRFERDAATAQQICRQCPVITECAHYAETTGACYGVWGGK